MRDPVFTAAIHGSRVWTGPPVADHSMQIEVHLFATLRQGRFQQKTLQVAPDSTTTGIGDALLLKD